MFNGRPIGMFDIEAPLVYILLYLKIIKYMHFFKFKFNGLHILILNSHYI